MSEQMDEEQLHQLLVWIDQVPLSRPKRNLTRDFSDAVACAEVIAHFHPRLVELHNYSAANSVAQKTTNWRLLNRKVFTKLKYRPADYLIDQIVKQVPGAIEELLFALRERIDHTPRERSSSISSASRSRATSPNSSPNLSRRSPSPSSAARQPRSQIAFGSASSTGRHFPGKEGTPEIPTKRLSITSPIITEGRKSLVKSTALLPGVPEAGRTNGAKGIEGDKDSIIQELRQNIEALKLESLKLHDELRRKDDEIMSLKYKRNDLHSEETQQGYNAGPQLESYEAQWKSDNQSIQV